MRLAAGSAALRSARACCGTSDVRAAARRGMSACDQPGSAILQRRPQPIGAAMAAADDIESGSGSLTEPVLPGLKTAAQLGFEVVQEQVVWSRWLQVSDRTIRFPAQGSREAAEHHFDVVGHPRAGFTFVVVVPFHPAAPGQPEPEITLLREYAQGVGEMMFVLPSGAYDPQRHLNDPLTGAKAELSEEAHLSGGEWIDLLPGGLPGPPESKWCQNRLRPYLCVGPQPDASPGEREAEEHIEVHRVTIPQLRRILRSRQMMLPSVCTCYYALDELAERGLL